MKQDNANEDSLGKTNQRPFSHGIWLIIISITAFIFPKPRHPHRTTNAIGVPSPERPRADASPPDSDFDRQGLLQHSFAIEQFNSITQALGQASDPAVHGRAAGFLRRAAQSLADAGRGDAPESAGESIDDEIRALSDLLTRKRRWLSVDEVDQVHVLCLLPVDGVILGVAGLRGWRQRTRHGKRDR